MSNNPLQDVFTLFDGGKLKEQNEGRLRWLYGICVNCQASDSHSRTKADHIAKAILAEMLRLQNDRLAEQVDKLTHVASAQKELAEEARKQAEHLADQTKRLVHETITLTRFTRGQFWLACALVFFAVVQIVIMLFEYASINH